MNRVKQFISVKRNKFIVIAILLALDIAISLVIFFQDKDPNKDYMEILFWAVVNPGTILLTILILLVPIAVIKFIINKIT